MTTMTPTDLAQEVRAAYDRASQKLQNEDDRAGVYGIHVFLQPYDLGNQWGKGYTVHCDQSYGGTDEREQAVRDELPNAIVMLKYDADKYEDATEAFEAALEEVW